MAKLKTWQYKNRKKPRKYRTSLGTTDYDIPMFGYRSALIILLVTFLALLELIKIRTIQVFQDESFSNILIKRRRDIE